MGLSDRLAFRVLNDLVHDLTAGMVPGAVAALWMVRNGAAASLTPEALAGMVRGWSWIIGAIFIAMVVFIVTGALRLNYRARNISSTALAAQGRSALIKHAFFVAAFAYAVVMAFVVLQP